MRKKDDADRGHNRSIYINKRVEELVNEKIKGTHMSFSEYLTELILDDLNTK